MPRIESTRASGLPTDIAETALAAAIALKVGIPCAAWVYDARLGGSGIDGLYASSITMFGLTDKGRDYATLFAFLAITLGTFMIASEIVSRLARRLGGDARASFLRALLITSLPALYFAASLLISPSQHDALIELSLLGDTVVILCALTAAATGWAAKDGADARFEIVPAILFFALAAALVSPAAVSLAMALSAEAGAPDVATLTWVAVRLVLAGVGLACILAFAFEQGDTRLRTLGALSVLAQIMLLPGLLFLWRPVIEIDGVVLEAVPGGWLAVPVLLALSVAAVVHLGRSLIRSGVQDPGAALGTVSPICAVLAVMAIRFPFNEVSSYLPFFDEYHSGEFILPYWAMKTYDLMPYVDLAPARGWVNVVYGMIAEEWFGGTLASYAYASGPLGLLIYLVLILGLTALLGPWIGFAMLLVVHQLVPIFQLDLFITGLFAALLAAIGIVPSVLWLCLWVLFGTVAVLFAIGQGGLFVVATMPLGLYVLARAAREGAWRLGIAILGAALAAGIVLLTPLGDLILGALRYGIEQSDSNAPAYGIPWSAGTLARPATNGLAWEAARFGWLLVTIGVGVVTWYVLRNETSKEVRRRTLLIGVPILLFGFIYISRAAGRIDVGSLSRPGVTSAWFVCSLLPLFLLHAFGRRWALVSFVVAVGVSGGMRFDSLLLWEQRRIARHGGAAFEAAGQLGVGTVGQAPLEAALVEDYAALKVYADSVLEPGAPFLDLTNRNALAYHLDRPPALEVAAYNLVSPRQQARVVAGLQADPPELVLAHDRSIYHDGGPVSLRAHPLYRFVVETYRPLEVDGAIWMRPADGAPVTQADLDLLDRAFAPPALGQLPAVWADAWSDGIAEDVHAPVPLSFAYANQMSIGAGGLGRSQGTDPYIVFDVPPGTPTDTLLSVQFVCEVDPAVGDPSIQIRVYFSTDLAPTFTEDAAFSIATKAGRLMIPLDAFPRWYLAETPLQVRIDLDQPDRCGRWGLRAPVLWSRVEAGEDG